MLKFPDFMTALAAGLAVIAISAVWSRRANAMALQSAADTSAAQVFSWSWLASAGTPDAVKDNRATLDTTNDALWQQTIAGLTATRGTGSGVDYSPGSASMPY